MQDFLMLLGFILQNSGNKCGHDPKNFRIPDSQRSEKKSSIIRKTIQLLNERSSTWIANHYRTEQQEAMLAVLTVCVDSMDIWTLGIGCPTKDGWFAYGWRNRILHMIPWLSERRLFRALRGLVDLGWFESNQRLADPRYITRDEKTPSGYAVSEKRLTPKFFEDLGGARLLKHLERCQEWSAKKMKQRAAEAGKKITDFYTRVIATAKKKSALLLAKAGLAKQQTETSSVPVQSGMSPRAFQLNLWAAIKGFVNDANITTQRLIAQFGYIDALLKNPQSFILQLQP